MGDHAIQVDNIGKRYRIGTRQHHRSLRESLMNGLRAPVRGLRSLTSRSRNDSASDTIWALKGVSFEVKRGEVLGVIGRNGAGKSTLLKILSRITEPTEGRVRIAGRVGSLLEVGTGFHSELTGRENIFLNGAILGMSKAEIRRKFEEIVSFAEVEKFIDTPVKHYSSGMSMRLAFAVAAHLEPEILLVDEVLAVGDAAFQRKSLDKIKDITGSQGRTVLLVSHNITAIANLCDSAIWLVSGNIHQTGPAFQVAQDYMTDPTDNALSDEVVRFPIITPELTILSFDSCTNDGAPSRSFLTSEELCLAIEYENKQALPGLRVGVDLYSMSSGETIFRTFDDDLQMLPRHPGRVKAVCRIPRNLLRPGTYLVKLQIGIHYVKWISNDKIYLKVDVYNLDGVNARYADGRPGVIMPAVDWQIDRP
jgi:lipopolysaccharide transport system ATP-binding protein